MIVGGYSIHLYCDTGNETPDMPRRPPHDFDHPGTGEGYGQTEAEAKRQARKAGWRFDRVGRAFCPFCERQRKAK